MEMRKGNVFHGLEKSLAAHKAGECENQCHIPAQRQTCFRRGNSVRQLAKGLSGMKRLLAPLILLAIPACVSPPDTGGETLLERRHSYAIAFIVPGSPPTQEPFGNRINLVRYANGDYWMTSTLYTTTRCRTRMEPALGERIATAWRRASPMFAQINGKYATLDYVITLGSGASPLSDGSIQTPLDGLEQRLTDLTDAMDAWCRDARDSNRDRLDASLRTLEQN